eukprot:46298-Eustigmatos_ZCMA.PRE.1
MVLADSAARCKAPGCECGRNPAGSSFVEGEPAPALCVAHWQSENVCIAWCDVPGQGIHRALNGPSKHADDRCALLSYPF